MSLFFKTAVISLFVSISAMAQISFTSPDSKLPENVEQLVLDGVQNGDD